MAQPANEPVKLEVTLKYATVSEFDARFAANVAGQTVFLKTPKPKPVGSVVALELHLAGGEVVLAGQGPVICAFEGASVPAGRQAGMIIGLEPADDSSAKRIRSIVLKYGQGKNAVLPEGVAVPTPAPPAQHGAPAQAPKPARPDSLDDLSGDLDAAIAGLGSGDTAPVAPSMPPPPGVHISTEKAPSLFDPGPGLVMVQPAAAAAPPATSSPAPTSVPPPSPPATPAATPSKAAAAQNSVDALTGSSWTDELEAALGTAFDVDAGLPVPPGGPAAAPAASQVVPLGPISPSPPALDGMFGPPRTLPAEPAGTPKLSADRAFAMPPPAPAVTPTGGVPRVEPPAESAGAAEDRAGLQTAGADDFDDDMLAPLPTAEMPQAPEPGSAAPQGAETATATADDAPAGEDPAPPSNITDESLQAIAAGLPPAEFRPAFKPAVPMPPPVVVAARKRQSDPGLRSAGSADAGPEEPGAALGAVPDAGAPTAQTAPAGLEGEPATPQPEAIAPSATGVDAVAPAALASHPVEDAPPHPVPEPSEPVSEFEPAHTAPMPLQPDTSDVEPPAPIRDGAASTTGDAGDLDAELAQGLPPLGHAEHEPEETLPVRVRRPRSPSGGRTLAIVAAAGGLIGLVLFGLVRLLFAEPAHITQFREANALVRTGMLDEAIASYEQILAAHPEFTLAKRHLAVAHALKGDRAKAEQLLRSYVGTSDDIADVETVKKYLGEAEATLVE